MRLRGPAATGLRASLGELVDLLLPRRCLGCARPAVAWCADCLLAATRVVGHEPQPAPAGFPRTTIAATYALDVRAALIAYKDRGRRDLRPALAGLLAAAVQAHDLPGALLLPMPSTPAADRRRGGSHLVALARAAARFSGHRVVVGLGSRAAPDAVRLGAAARLETRRRALYPRTGLGELLTGRAVVLVDDLVTTGATLATAADLVRRAGAGEVRAACVAAPERLLIRV